MSNQDEKAESLIQRILRISQEYADLTALMYKDAKGNFIEHSYRELALDFMKMGFFLRHRCGVKKGDHISIICDNRYEWVPIDLGILSVRAVDVPRGSDTRVEEIAYILAHSDSIGCVFENVKIFSEIYDYDKALIKKLKFAIIIDGVPYDYKQVIKNTFSYKDIMNHQLSTEEEEEITQSIADTSPDDMATIIYTSGTTAKPKGVCLTQGAFEVQIDRIKQEITINPRQVFLSVLPLWHAYAREIQYVVMGRGATIAFSKPIGKILLEDIKKANTSYMTSVPRIWEGVYSAIHRNVKKSSAIKRFLFHSAVKIGIVHTDLYNLIIGNLTCYKSRIRPLDILLGMFPYLLLLPIRYLLDALVFKKIRAILSEDFIAGVSGGGALPSHIDNFFAAARIKILEGYGLTETGPVLSVRNLRRPQMGTVGKIFNGIECRIINSDGKLAEIGESGVLYVRSNQTMKGYYKNKEGTEAILSEDGWLNTGDIVKQSTNAAISIVGRAKDTIVLTSGENVEPEHVEMMLSESDFIDVAMVFGQDKKAISALIVPNHEELLKYAFEYDLGQNIEVLCEDTHIREHFRKIIETYRSRLMPFEQIFNFVLVAKAFEVGDELTQTMKMKRPVISEKYKKEMDNCYH